MNTKLKPEQLLQFREQLELMREDYNEREWETLKFFTTMFSGLVSLTVLVEYIPEITKGTTVIKTGLLAVPVLALCTSLIGFANFRREYYRLMETVSMIMRIDKKLGFYARDYFPTRWKTDYEEFEKSEEEWLKNKMKIKLTSFMRGKASFMTVASTLFIAYIAISFLLLVWIGFVLFFT